MQHNILSGEGRGTTSSVKHGGRVMSSVKQGDGLTTSSKWGDNEASSVKAGAGYRTDL